MSGFRKNYNSIETLKKRVTALEVSVDVVPVTGAIYQSASMTVEGNYHGNLLYAGDSSHASVVGSNLVYLNSSKEWKQASAGNGGEGSGSITGIALSATPHTHGVLVQGVYRMSSSLVYSAGADGALAIGAQVYMDPLHSGSLTTILPSGSGEVVRVVGHSIDSDMVYINPSPDYVEI